MHGRNEGNLRRKWDSAQHVSPIQPGIELGSRTDNWVLVITSAVRPNVADSGVPKFAATYVHNRTPTKALGGCPPYEVLSTVLHLRAFWGAVRHRRAERIASVIKDVFLPLGISTVGAVGVHTGCGTRIVESRYRLLC